MSQQNREGERKLQYSLCQRQFSTERGRSLHLNACKRQRHGNLSQLVRGERSTVTTVNVSAANASNLQRSSPLCVWGRLTKDDRKQVVDTAYEEIVYRRKKLFLLPSGAAGKSFVREAERLISVWNSGSQQFYDRSLKLVMIMPGLLLQNPSFKSTSKEHALCFGTTLAVMGTRRL